MKNSQYLYISAALLGSTFVFAEPEVVESTADVVLEEPVKTITVPASNEEAIAELLFQFQSFQMELSEMRGQVEQLNFELQQLKLESKDRYIDLDRRISETKQGSGAPLVRTTTESTDKAVEQKVDPAQIQSDYNLAKDLIRQKDYVGAIQAFNEFVTRYPVNDYTANSYYWMGEVYLVIPDVPKAIDSFKAVVDQFGDHHKHPDALYRLGITLLKNAKEADGRKYLEQLIELYPDSQLISRAKKALGSS